MDQMFREMEEASQPDPKYIHDDFLLKATLRAKEHVEDNIPHESGDKTTQELPRNFQEGGTHYPRKDGSMNKEEPDIIKKPLLFAFAAK